MTKKLSAAAGLIVVMAVVPAAASEPMPTAQQTALVQKYCTVCHSDAHLNGGLSFEHFDAAKPDPGVAAMIVSKLTNGVPLKTTSAIESDPAAAAIVAGKMKTGAMGAAGIPIPDRAMQDALVSALSSETSGANAWNVNHDPILTATILQEVPSPAAAPDVDSYRLTLTCNARTREGAMQLSWSPGATKAGQPVSVAVDGKAPFIYKAEGNEKVMFTGATGTSGTAAVILYATRPHPGVPEVAMKMPARTLTVSNLFPNETVTFPFDGLSRTDRRTLSTCFRARAGK